ncbi:twin-arginine translocase TatA/TatE family subunit [Candidatus Nitrosacidococcus sp. I8]|uniref:twin-arginine translocase TatA/TatE family subunit n=1 Tax=Candidatus Nitrosacidococcus sp. I8 TaxID=2942908 RepID=UPI002226835B|nr:twin-arginine translocase TatA/TatE family subunit [Candidatus Nitrosacidococcus sp. I8]CAH9019878.1 Sec-independent protein translocase protein TatA [Candidatus Nitrosacidococcus sp. I8]
MGISGISIWQLLIILGIVLVLFGTKKLRTIGGDLGEAVRNFREAMKDEKSSSPISSQPMEMEHKQQDNLTSSQTQNKNFDKSENN